MPSGLTKNYYDLPIGTQEPLEPIKCVCGVDITMGAEAQSMFHSDYCPKSDKYKPKEVKNETGRN